MIHSKAFGSGIVVVLNEDTRITSAIEYNLSTSNPALESYIYTFTNTDDLIAFSKNRTDISLCILSDKSGQTPGLATFENIRKISQPASYDARLVLTYINTPILEIYRNYRKTPLLLDYISVSDLTTTSEQTQKTLKDLVDNYNQSIETDLVPEELGLFLFDSTSNYTLKFNLAYERVAILLTSQLNLSAIEIMLVKWIPYISNQTKSAPKSKIIQFLEKTKKENPEVYSKIINISEKIKDIASIDIANLNSHFVDLKQSLRPSSPAIHRLIVRNSEKIALILTSANSPQTNIDYLKGAA